ncbi:hypothetical protein BJV78DRAFT_1282337 [Lactifluus subvellereus]|nr:hypothetical protein BJV78DRAFT_1282337 [Lactifluus subvellereus]
MPRQFLAPNLHRLNLLGVTLFTRPPSLASTVALVTLTLTNIRALAYYSPEPLVAQLQFVPLLEELSIGFSVPVTRSSTQMRVSGAPTTRIALSSLRRWFNVALFNQLTFTLPLLSRFVDTTPGFRFPIADVTFHHNSISISARRHKQARGDRSFYLHVSCQPFDLQVTSAAQICRELSPMLSVVDELSLDFYEHGMPVDPALASEISDALQPDGAGRVILPELQELVLQLEGGCDDDAFSAFIDARQRAGHPVELVVGSPMRLSGAHRSSPPPRLQGTYITSQPMAFRTPLSGSDPTFPSADLPRPPELNPASPTASETDSAMCPVPLVPPRGSWLERYIFRGPPL